MEIEQFDTKADFLARCTKILAEKHPRSSSYSALSKRIGVPSSTFERIAKKEVKSPSFHNALKIVQAVCEDGDVLTFIKKFYPEMLADYEKAYPGNSKIPFAPPRMEEFFKNAVTYELMLFISSADNLTRQDVAKKFGEKGLGILEDLKSGGMLEKSGELSIDGPIKLGQEVNQALLQNLIRNNYDLKSFGEKDNWLSVQWHSVNMKKALPELREACVKMAQETWDIVSDPKYKGDDVVWVGAVMDTLLRTSSKKREENDNSQQGGLIQ